MSFETDITRMPQAFDAQIGRDTRAAIGKMPPQTADLIAGAAGCSPYLSTLTLKEADWLRPAVLAPDDALREVFATLRGTPSKELPVALRRAKRRIALLTGLADLGGVWPLEKVTATLTDFADLAVTLALRASIGAQIARGKLPGMGQGDIEDAGGMTVLAMGKMGAHELNYSSDIDLICLFDEKRFAPDDFHDARTAFVKATRAMSAMLNDLTGEGYVFRTDLRLRPDPSVTPVCMAMEAAERYYESLGRTWERAAYIKARPCGGDLDAGARFLDTLTPFVWRKHLDFAAIQDAHDMRLRYREHKGASKSDGGQIRLEAHNMKLGRGGIREIEFFTQTRQIIAGGRDMSLRLRGTEQSLAMLAQKGWVPEQTAQTLTEHYRYHREVEHRLQMLRDQQTHTLPDSEAGFARLAAFMGVEVAEMRKQLSARLSQVHEITEGFFAPDAPPSSQGQMETHIHGGAGADADADADADLGAQALDGQVIGRWQSYPALRSARAVEIFERLKPDVLRRLGQTPRPEEALLAFDGFLSGLPAGVQLFSLFEANPQLIDLLIDIVGTAPALSRYLARNAAVFDGVIGGNFFGPWPGQAGLETQLAAVLARESDYERKLDATRRWAKEWHFGVGVHHLRGLIEASEASTRYADLAGATIAALWPHVVEQFALKHGPMPGRGAVIVGMGSLGAGRLNATSDLDLIMIYDPAEAEASQGARPLPVRQYYARLTKAMVTAMTAPMAEGRLYEVDMRLRPSGTQGPVATSWQSFASYQRENAWLWEHLALTRARVVAGSAGLGADVDALRCEIIGMSRAEADILAGVAEMRTRIQAAKQGTLWDGKIGAGRLQDIELMGQAGLLGSNALARDIPAGLAACHSLGWISAQDHAVLARSYSLFQTLHVASKLLSETVLPSQALSDHIGLGGCAFLLRETQTTSLEALEATVTQAAQASAAVLEAALHSAGGGDTPCE